MRILTDPLRFGPTVWLVALLIAVIVVERGAADDVENAAFRPEIPVVWDEDALARLELPLADGEVSVQYASAEYYYSLPVRMIYRHYPVYAPGREPRGYFESLTAKRPEVVFDVARLDTKKDWIEAGKLVFQSPLAYIPVPAAFRDEDTFEAHQRSVGELVAADGVVPFVHYVVREKGKVELGIGSCADCHTRVMPDGSVVLGAQGNRPVDRIIATLIRTTVDDDPNEAAVIRHAHMASYGTPWIKEGRNQQILQMGPLELARWHEAIPAGVMARQGASIFWPVQIPDLIGIEHRRYLDKTGLVRHRSIGDLMRYAALNQGMDYLTRYGDFIPAGKNYFKDRRPVGDLPRIRGLVGRRIGTRYSDEQLYALGMFLYSLQPPPNRNEFDALARQGRAVFEKKNCGRCHTPPHYTNNRLMRVDGFRIPIDHPERAQIDNEDVGTDSNLALKTRRGTGLYKVPSLTGLWYRGPLEHNGSVATLEDWFDRRRLSDDYVTTGWKPLDVENRAVRGHEYGLNLSADEKRALIAFLRTL